ncbi:outer membrane beta-barrel protein [Alloacidobacterium dinghuense]|uniref:Outer membrane beta-barrel protein n=1 Tax=Alloacidobacterium dinghuense TaxID=2763107 RepID=A0A7G8BET3_9BACT|nr:outer membrane beta-barrel protein [Alloacidobacterium dinghuense]QNI31053.1 outer membrane beta-barrel protein [Alloacidobacterium dinghuense]
MYRSCWKPSLMFAALLVASLFAQPASAQSYLKNSEVGLNVFGQFTSSSNGNGIEVKPLDSIGGQATFRHVYSPLLGYEAGYGYTRFSDRYSSYPFAIQHNVHEFEGSYLLSSPSLLGVRPFGLAGVSALLYAPTLNGGQNASAQARAAITFGVGGDFPILTSHFGLRVQYRGLYHQTPDYGDPRFKTGTWRLSSEPAVGAYLHF